ncbi:hypothetical protein QQF64_000940 [Cirrhinus molitorella]|uniref:Uncharacterized protein n=1 Tax=Cirrhinus molitorella TaxID=172907 RepID=A0ABR3NYL1_9TELE
MDSLIVQLLLEQTRRLKPLISCYPCRSPQIPSKHKQPPSTLASQHCLLGDDNEKRLFLLYLSKHNLQPPPSGYTEIRSYTSSRCFLTEIQQSRECAPACLPESAARVQIIRARVCFLSSGSGSAVDVKRYWSPRCVQSVRYVSVSSTGSVINEGSSITNAEP